MWKSILKQMWNRRRSNGWLAVELLFVFCLTWYIVDYLFVYNYHTRIPNYRNIDHTLQINIAELPEEHPEYRKDESEGDALVANYQRVIQVVKDYPGVEEVGVSYGGASPGSGNYWGLGLCIPGDTITQANGQRITIDPAYDFFKVFGYSTDNGNKPVSVKDFDWGVSNGVVIGRKVEQMLYPGGSAFGKELEAWKKPDERYIVTGVVDDIKRFDYNRPQNAYYLSRPLKADNVRSAEISLRHNASFSSRAFRDKFKTEMTDRLRVGNFYLLSVIPYTVINDTTDRDFGITNNIKLRLYMMIFFFLNIMLCMIGTFWYRINQRPNEIGLRKAVGATSRSIHTSLVQEGIFLLLLIIIPAMAIEYQFVHLDMIETMGVWGDKDPAFLPDRTIERFLITNGITFVLMATVVTAAIWLPALKGALLAPAEALRHE